MNKVWTTFKRVGIGVIFSIIIAGIGFGITNIPNIDQISASFVLIICILVIFSVFLAFMSFIGEVIEEFYKQWRK